MENNRFGSQQISLSLLILWNKHNKFEKYVKDTYDSD